MKIFSKDNTKISMSSISSDWKSKKEYVAHMSWFNKILYYLWIIVLYKHLPITISGHLVNNTPVLQTHKSSTYTSYWHWNYWNPLTYIVIILFIIFMFIMNIIISIIQTLKITSIIKIDIEE